VKPGLTPQFAAVAGLPDVMSRTEVAAYCRVSLRTFDSHIQPFLPAARIGRRVLFLRADVLAWIESKARSTSVDEVPVASGGGLIRDRVSASTRAQEILAHIRHRRARRRP